ncbi:MAG: amidohydrolase [Ignavibacteria bacterium]|jgi:predicted amidohydrolase
MSKLKVTIIQSSLHWENIDKNIKMFSRKLDSLKEKTDLIVLPEMFTTGFTKNAKDFAEDINGKAINFLKEYSKKLKAGICGSVIIKSGNKFFNRLVYSSPTGKISYYDKRHLFRMGKEHSVYSGGNKHLILKIKNWRVAFFICYDLRFPVWCRNRNNYDAAVFVANWPTERNYYWKSLLLARAIENQCYVIGANRTGSDGNGFRYSGDSAVINPMGKYILDAGGKDGIFSAVPDKNVLGNFRKIFPAYKDSDKFKIVL